MTADLTIKAEYIATSETTKEAVWFNKFITEIGVVRRIINLIPLTITMEPLYKYRNRDLISNPKIFLSNVI